MASPYMALLRASGRMRPEVDPNMAMTGGNMNVPSMPQPQGEFMPPSRMSPVSTMSPRGGFIPTQTGGMGLPPKPLGPILGGPVGPRPMPGSGSMGRPQRPQPQRRMPPNRMGSYGTGLY